MLTVNQKGFLILLYVFVGLAIFFIQVEKRKNFNQRCFTFIQYTIFGLPIIDFGMVPSQLNIKVFEFVTLSFFVLNFRSFLLQRNLNPNKMVKAFIIILIITGLTSAFAFNSLYETIKFTSYFLLFVIIIKATLANNRVPQFILEITALYAILFFSMQVIYGLNFSLYNNLNEMSLIESRYTSFAQDPQKMALIAYMLAIIFLGNFVLKSSDRSNRINIIFFILLSIIGLFTGSRASLFGFVIAVVLLLLLKVSIRSSVLVFSGFLIFLFLKEKIMSLTIFDRLADVVEALEGRSEIFWKEALQIFYKHPIFGIGHGNFGVYVSNFAKDLTYGNEQTIDQPESGYLLWLVETGTIGALFYLYFLIKLLVHENKNMEGFQHKLALFVWMAGFVSVYSFSDIRVVYLIVTIASVILSDKYFKKVKIQSVHIKK